MVRWEGGKGGKLVGVASWERGESGEVESDVNQEKIGWSDFNQGNKEDVLNIYLCACRDGKTLLRSYASC